MAVRLRYDRGSLHVTGADASDVSRLAPDGRTGGFRARACDHRAVVEELRDRGIDFDDGTLDLMPAPPLRANVELRAYQQDALDAWQRAGMRGVVVLPTGAGKTVVALKAIEAAQQPTLVLVPTLDLVEQWRARLRDTFDVDVGAQGGGERSLEALTVATYDSAYLHAARWGDRFGLVVFDEAHHLPSEGHRHAAEMLAAPFRLGLTATYERPDGLHERLPDLVGAPVFELSPEDLAGEHLASYTVERIETDLTPEERARYDERSAVYRALLAERREFRGFQGHKRLIMRSAIDPRAREALLAREAARDVMLNSQTKLDVLARLLERHRGARILVFTEHNRLVETIRRRFLVPGLTHHTPPAERAEALAAFRSGRWPVLATSKVLDEGVDVPSASVGIILSGSGSRREFVQRLGRILRPEPGKHARLYEVVSRGTAEERISERRRADDRDDEEAERAVPP